MDPDTHLQQRYLLRHEVLQDNQALSQIRVRTSEVIREEGFLVHGRSAHHGRVDDPVQLHAERFEGNRGVAENVLLQQVPQVTVNVLHGLDGILEGGELKHVRPDHGEPT